MQIEIQEVRITISGNVIKLKGETLRENTKSANSTTREHTNAVEISLEKEGVYFLRIHLDGVYGGGWTNEDKWYFRHIYVTDLNSCTVTTFGSYNVLNKKSNDEEKFTKGKYESFSTYDDGKVKIFKEIDDKFGKYELYELVNDSGVTVEKEGNDYIVKTDKNSFNCSKDGSPGSGFQDLAIYSFKRGWVKLRVRDFDLIFMHNGKEVNTLEKGKEYQLRIRENHDAKGDDQVKTTFYTMEKFLEVGGGLTESTWKIISKDDSKYKINDKNWTIKVEQDINVEKITLELERNITWNGTKSSVSIKRTVDIRFIR